MEGTPPVDEGRERMMAEAITKTPLDDRPGARRIRRRKEATKDRAMEVSRCVQEKWRRGGKLLVAQDSKPRRPRIDPRVTPLFSNLEKFGKSYSKLLEKQFSSFSK
jgi:hypothetical protein